MKIELVKTKDGIETVLEVTDVPDTYLLSTIWYPQGTFEELEKHYKKTGKPKKSKIDVLYMTRLQKERFNK